MPDARGAVSKSSPHRAAWTLIICMSGALGLGACDDNCIDACPTPRAPAKCGAASATVSVDELLANPASFADTDVAARGGLAQGSGVCTQLACGSGCCNACGSRFALEGAAKAQIELAPADPQLACSGDDARICCPLTLGAEVVVMGRFRKESDTLDGPRFVLDQATICAM